ncbi:hypothetical protein KP509_37G015600 [Ceratopteris richardii]|nr:hypothetical protein KP509_37G015600 [Ceratopteris richardii]
MPVVLYAHGGAYTIGQPNWRCFHGFCSTLSRRANCICVSLAYRLAPAHRLPAAFEDGALALRWLLFQARLQHHDNQSPSFTCDPWLSPNLADFSRLFLAGDSAGANIMLKVSMDAADSGLENLTPVRIRGLLLIHPGFHCEERKMTHLDERNRKRYHLALPIGETLDYPPVNPIHPSAPSLSPLSAYPHILIMVAEADSRYDMTIRFFEMVRAYCLHTDLFISPGKGHQFHLKELNCSESNDLYDRLANFIKVCGTTNEEIASGRLQKQT